MQMLFFTTANDCLRISQYGKCRCFYILGQLYLKDQKYRFFVDNIIKNPFIFTILDNGVGDEGEIINNEYGIGYLYSITDNDILKITHKPNIEFKDKYNMIKAINVNDSNFKDHILINISDLPMQYLKYLDVLNKLEKNKKLSKSIVKEKRKIRDLFRIRKKNDR